MRIATRLWIALFVTTVLVLGTGVIVREREEERLLLDVTLRDRQFFAQVLSAALSPEHGNVDPLRQAERMLAREEISDAHIVARLVSASPGAALPAPRLPAADTGPLLRGEVLVGAYEDALLTYVPLHAPGLAIELAEPHAIGEVLAQVGWRSLLLQASALTALAGFITFVLVRWLVGVPLEQLSQLARRIGAGELSARATVRPGRDEVAILAREMNGMGERLEQARRSLEELDAERVAALEQLRHADRLRTVGQIASTLAHELGTPLNVVSGHARLIEQDAGSEELVRSSARAILEQTTRMARIIKDVLGLSRRRGARADLHDLSEIAERATRMLEPLTRKQGVHIQVRVHQRARVRADGQQLLQVLTNLLTNAMQATPKGGEVRIAVDQRQADPPLGVHAKPGTYACVAVIDAGVGIASEDVPHLFEPFFTRRDDGTGLGLVVVEGIVKEHKGWVEVRSSPGKGSRFEVYLPATSEDSHD